MGMTPRQAVPRSRREAPRQDVTMLRGGRDLEQQVRLCLEKLLSPTIAGGEVQMPSDWFCFLSDCGREWEEEQRAGGRFRGRG